MANKAAVLDEALSLSVADAEFISSLRQSWIEATARGGEEEVHARVQYAVGLSKSALEAERIQALAILQESLSEADYLSEVLHALALTNYSLGRYSEARTWCEELLTMKPDHQQVRDLHNAIVYKHNREQNFANIALTVVGVGVAAAATILALALQKRK